MHDFGLRLPISDPVMIFALAMAIFVGVPLLFERLRVPGIIGLIVAGALIGPNGLGWLERDETIVLLGTVGLLYLMFTAGVEIDLHGFGRYRNRSLIFGAITFTLPQVLGIGLGFLLGYGWAAAILLGSTLASHTLLAYPIASRLGIAKNEAVTAAVGGTIVTDLAALLVLAVIAASAEGELNAAFWVRLVGSLAVFVTLILLGLPRLGRWFFRYEEDSETGAYIFVLAALFVSAVLAELAGVEPIIGAFLAGLALNRLVPEGSPLNNRLHFFGNAFFIPFFLISVGMLVDVRVLAGSARPWQVMIGLSAVVIAAKWLAARITQRLFGFSGDEGWAMFGLSVPQAAATLAAVLIGYQIRLFDTAVLNGTIMMILITCTIGPWVVERFGRRIALRGEEKPYEPSEAPQRILIPIHEPTTADALLDLAFLIRDPASDEPLLPITVVPGDGQGAAARIAAAEKLLGHVAIYAAGADVPVVPLTRVSHNYTSGIVRGMAESRASTVVVGWDGRRSARHRVFGGVIDPLIARTQQLVLVARLDAPLNTSGRVVVLLPLGIRRSPGFCEAVRTLKLMANRLGAPLLGLVVAADPVKYEKSFEETKPAVPATFEEVEGWHALAGALRERIGEDDLVVVLSARRGALAWNRELERLPRWLARLPNNFVVVYPSEAEVAEPEDAPASAPLPRALAPERVVFDLPRMPVKDVAVALLATEFGTDDLRTRSVTRLLARDGLGAPAELVPGVVFASAPVEGIARPLMFLGISPNGILFPNAEEPARLIFLLLSPANRPPEHLKHVAEVARLVSNPERVQELCDCRTSQNLFDWFRADEVGERTSEVPPVTGEPAVVAAVSDADER